MDDAKKTILARRARFLAAAVAGVAVGACDDKPRACLEPPMVTTTTPSAQRPSICLSMVHIPPDAGTDDTAATTDAGARDAASDAPSDAASDAGRKKTPVGPPPRSCLSMF